MIINVKTESRITSVTNFKVVYSSLYYKILVKINRNVMSDCLQKD